MNHVENCVEDHIKYFKSVENHIENFKAWVVLQKKALCDCGRDLLKTYFTELIQLKYKLILWIKTMGCCGLACVV